MRFFTWGFYIFQQDGAPSHWKLTVRAYLNENLPERWIGCGGEEDNSLLKWPPGSPDLSPCDFFLWGYVKGLVYVPPLPANVEELKQRITAASETYKILPLWFRVDLGVMAMQEYSTLNRAPKLEPHH